MDAALRETAPSEPPPPHPAGPIVAATASRARVPSPGGGALHLPRPQHPPELRETATPAPPSPGDVARGQRVQPPALHIPTTRRRAGSLWDSGDGSPPARLRHQEAEAEPRGPPASTATRCDHDEGDVLRPRAAQGSARMVAR